MSVFPAILNSRIDPHISALQNTPSLKLLSALTFTDMAHDGPTEINTAWTDGCFALFVLADVSNDVRDLAEN